MAEHNFRFGYLTTQEIEYGLEHKILKPFFILYNKDNHTQYIVKEDYTLFAIRSKVPIYSSVDDANSSIELDGLMPGDVVSILNGDNFNAYIVQRDRNGNLFVKQIINESQFSYNDLNDIPIKVVGELPTQRVVITDLEDGYYKVHYFVSPSGAEIDSVVGNMFVIETLPSGVKNIKRITTNSVFDYVVDVNGKAAAKKYATEDFVKSQGYMTSADVDLKLQAMDIVTTSYLEEYVTSTCEMLCRHLIRMELEKAEHYATEEDIRKLFETVMSSRRKR